jgi:hypothetical protein
MDSHFQEKLAEFLKPKQEVIKTRAKEIREAKRLKVKTSDDNNAVVSKEADGSI